MSVGDLLIIIICTRKKLIHTCTIEKIPLICKFSMCQWMNSISYVIVFITKLVLSATICYIIIGARSCGCPTTVVHTVCKTDGIIYWHFSLKMRFSKTSLPQIVSLIRLLMRQVLCRKFRGNDAHNFKLALCSVIDRFLNYSHNCSALKCTPLSPVQYYY